MAILKPDPQRPPLYTVWQEFCGWTLDWTAAIPKAQRFTFGQRLDGHHAGRVAARRALHPQRTEGA